MQTTSKQHYVNQLLISTATRTADQKYHLLIAAIKANQYCRNERQNLSLARSTPLGKHIEPEIAKEAAISLIDCFHKIQLNPLQAERRKIPIQCLKKGGNCEQEISTYLNPK